MKKTVKKPLPKHQIKGQTKAKAKPTPTYADSLYMYNSTARANKALTNYGDNDVDTDVANLDKALKRNAPKKGFTPTDSTKFYTIHGGGSPAYSGTIYKYKKPTGKPTGTKKTGGSVTRSKKRK